MFAGKVSSILIGDWSKPSLKFENMSRQTETKIRHFFDTAKVVHSKYKHPDFLGFKAIFDTSEVHHSKGILLNKIFCRGTNALTISQVLKYF